MTKYIEAFLILISPVLRLIPVYKEIVIKLTKLFVIIFIKYGKYILCS